MKQPERLWWVGAYALTATLAAFTEKDAAGFYTELQTLPQLAGLELPVHRLEKRDDPWRHLQHLPRNLDYIVTPLPYVMQSLEAEPLFGLASPDEEGRAAALQAIEDFRIRIRRLEDHCGRAAVRALELHSAPTRMADAAAFKRSLEEILRKDWGPVELWVEHCDAFRPAHTPAKGFLDIEAELAILRELPLGMMINWGRSVLETRNPETALEHLRKAHESGVLRGVFFSSVAVDDPVYGTWLDNHAPIQGLGRQSWEPRTSLLTRDRVRAALHAAADVPFRGLKIQPAPSTLPLKERLQCIRRHLEFLSGAEMS